MKEVQFKENHVCRTTRVVYTAGKKYPVTEDLAKDYSEAGVLVEDETKRKTKINRRNKENGES